MARKITPEQLAKGTKLAFSPVYRIDSKTVVKTHTRTAEAEKVKFIRANTSIPVPEVQNAYRDDETGQAVIIMDYVEGKTLTAAWADFTQAEQDLVISQFRGYMAQLRCFKADFIGYIDGSACNDQDLCEYPEGYGLY